MAHARKDIHAYITEIDERRVQFTARRHLFFLFLLHFIDDVILLDVVAILSFHKFYNSFYFAHYSLHHIHKDNNTVVLTSVVRTKNFNGFNETQTQLIHNFM